MSPRIMLFFLASLLPIAIGSQASAAKLRLHMDTSLFNFTKNSYDFSHDGYTNRSSITTFGMGDSDIILDEDFTSSGSLFRLGIGGVFMNHLVIGINLGLAIAHVKWKDEDENDGYGYNDEFEFNIYGFHIMPYISYKFGSGKVQPFVIATLGYKGAMLVYDEDDDAIYKIMIHQFAASGGAGIHIFLTRSLSFDISAMAGGAFGKYVEKEEYRNEEEKDKYPVSSLKVNVFIGLSGWI